LRPGALIADRFVVERRAGAGGMSIVYRARDGETGAPCAVKVLARAEPRLLERFDREARLLAELRHPGIVRYLTHGITTEGDRYLAMEWLEGEDLSERLSRAPLAISDTLTLARVVAEALHFAHARGVVHRDVKPSNLYLPDGQIERVKVLDFGIARLLDDSGASTRTGVRVGTPSYMSPEQARGLSKIDGRTDVFSLG
jgi:eukaryotic-like serine/threonine-protein kinase